MEKTSTKKGFKDYIEKNLTKDHIIRMIPFLIVTIAIIFKGIAYQGFVANDDCYSLDLAKGFSMVAAVSMLYYISFALILTSFSFLFKGKGRIIYLFIIDILVTALFIYDLWYFRGFKTVPSVLSLMQTGNLENLGDSIASMISWQDIIYLIDIVILGVYTFVFRQHFKKNENNHRAVKGFLVSFIISFAYLAYLPVNLYILDNYVDMAYVVAGTEPNYTHKYLSTVGYHIHDAITTYINTRPYTLTDEDKEQMDKYFAFKNETNGDDTYFGAAKGKNLIYIQVESLENFVINQEVNGKEITPNINKLIGDSLYFPNIYEQVGEGTSSDCDFITNTGLLPVTRGATFFRYPANDYNSMPVVLENNGYETSVIHSDKGSFWNYQLALENGIKFQKFTDYFSFDIDDFIGMGLSDESYFRQIVPMIKELKEPYYSMNITLTSHAPFNLPEDKRELGLDPELDESKLGGYLESVHYMDKHLGTFLDTLEKEGMLENSIVVIMGDHAGVHKYYSSEIAELSNQEEWFQDKGNIVPIIIYDPSKTIEPKQFDIIGGQSDFMPTMLYLLGIPEEQYNMSCVGRSLLNTDKSYAVIIDGTMRGGEDLTEEEKAIAQTEWDISDKIIRANYNPYTQK